MAAPLLLLLLLLAACTRQPPAPRVERIAILRFENLGAGVSGDWMGRAFSEVITAELAGAPGIYAMPSTRMHALDRVLGPRPISLPGISAERSLALASGATRLGYGEYSVRGGRLSARLTIEDLRTGKMTQVVAAAAAGDVLAVASELARRISSRVALYGTNSVPALKAYMAAKESATATAQNLDQAIGADPVVAVAQPRDLGGLQLDLARAIVDQDEIVPRAVHFDKVNDHGNRLARRQARFQVEI